MSLSLVCAFQGKTPAGKNDDEMFGPDSPCRFRDAHKLVSDNRGE